MLLLFIQKVCTFHGELMTIFGFFTYHCWCCYCLYRNTFHGEWTCELKEMLRIFSTTQGSKSARTNLLFHPFPSSNKIKNSQLQASAKFVEVQLVLLVARLHYLVKKDPPYMNAPLRSTPHANSILNLICIMQWSPS